MQTGLLEELLCAVGRILLFILIELAYFLAGVFFPSIQDELRAARIALAGAQCQFSL
jgi:hypothetical protein